MQEESLCLFGKKKISLCSFGEDTLRMNLDREESISGRSGNCLGNKQNNIPHSP